MIEVAKVSREEFDISIKENYQRSIDDWNQLYNSKSDRDFLDDDGYPTDDALELIEKWHFNDAKGLFNFIHSIWHLASWGWKEGEEPHELFDGDKVYRYNISTAGWSGNESIIKALQANYMMWHVCWVQSRRGGHYIFELREYE